MAQNWRNYARYYVIPYIGDRDGFQSDTDRFGGIERLYGHGILEKLARAHVCIAGLGGAFLVLGSGAQVKVTLPGGKTITRTVTSAGNLTIKVKPKHGGMIYVRSTGCTNAKIKVFAPKRPTAHHPPAFTG